ncbi:cytochrome c oxidase subunit 3 family protein [Colwellia sp. E150_009]|tara:strand:- start:2144 stop:2767 length:624 start_codon:yes stop_codon:yes gene_type:complete
MNIVTENTFYLNGCGAVKNEPETVNKIPGNKAVWVGIFAELTEFALFFIIYFIAKAHYPEQFNQGPLQLNTLAGTLNTVALISSSYFVAKALASIRVNKPDESIKWLWRAILCGGIYLVIKVWEYHWNVDQGIQTNTNKFYTLYYYMTFNHLLHVGWASGSLIWAIFQLKSGRYTQSNHLGLTAIASYWHMVDLAWVIIFPLLYVLR